ncbi:MAG: hypothetical protein QM754_08290 [Tepidisphaeraceae bacterium]
MPRWRPLAVSVLLLGLSGMGLSGCNVIVRAAHTLPVPDIDAAYKKLVGQSVGVMVWADKSLTMDWPNLQLDAGNSIQNKLIIAQQSDVKDLKGTTFPYPPASFIKYQKEHPEIETMAVTDVAAKLGVQRLIYVEITDLSTRAEGGSTLFLGRAKATLKVLEVEKGVGTVGYSEAEIKAQFPENAPVEGVINANDRAMYIGAINNITTELVKRLIQHPAPEDRG